MTVAVARLDLVGALHEPGDGPGRGARAAGSPAGGDETAAHAQTTDTRIRTDTFAGPRVERCTADAA